jgi:hypothetical protein
MSHPLVQRLEQVRGASQRLVWWHALGWFFVATTIAFLLLTAGDYLLRPTDDFSRWLVWLLWMGALLWSGQRWLWSAWQFQPALLETAEHLERYFPVLQGRLAGSLEFLSQTDDDPQAGSAALRRRVISSTTAAVENLPFQEALAKEPRRRAWVCLLGTLLFFVGWLAWDRASLAIAAQRIAAPWSQVDWPRQHHLAFVDPPSRVARGTTLELAVIDTQQRLPDEVTLIVRRTSGELERQAMKFLADRMVIRLENMVESLEYRAIGGDDHTLPWRKVEVVEPLGVSNLSLQVEPPPYAGVRWEAQSTQITLLAGSQLLVSGTFDQSVKTVSIRRQGSDAAVALALDAAGRTFQSTGTAQPWLAQQSGTYQLWATDHEGVSYPPIVQWELRVLPDLVPTVQINEPLEEWLVTPQALLPVSGTAKDDLALQEIQLRYALPNAAEVSSAPLPLWKAEPNPQESAEGKRASSTGVTEHFHGEWDLRERAGLQAGQILSWQVEAVDYLPQTGNSPATKLKLLSMEELQERLAQRQRSALAQLAEAMKLERDSQQEIESLQLQWEKVRQLRSRDRDQLASAELLQRQVHHLAGRTTGGAITLLEKVLRELQINRVPAGELQEQAGLLLKALRELEKFEFTQLTQQFDSLQLVVRTGNSIEDSALAILQTIHVNQTQVIEKLEILLGDLNAWDHFQQLHKDFLGLLKQEREVEQKTKQLQQEILLAGEPTEQQQTDLKQLARRQAELVRQVEKWLARLLDFSQRTEQNVDSQQIASAAADRISETALVANMRSVVESLDKQRFGEGIERQQQVIQSMEAVLETLAGRKTSSAQRSIEKLRDSGQRLNELLREQQAIAEQLEGAQQQPASELAKLADRQTQLEQAAKAAAESLKKQAGAAEASTATQQAAESMQQAAEAAGEQQAKEAAEKAREAEQKLQAAKQAIQKAVQQQEADLLSEQLVKLEQVLQGFLVRQAALHKETLRLQKLPAAANQTLTPAQQTSCQELSREQQSLAEEVKEQSRSPQLPSVFAWQLEQITSLMQGAGSDLSQQALELSTGKQTDALTRLQLMLTALEPNAPPDAPPQDPPPDQPPPPPNENQPPPSIHDLAEVKLLRGLQAEINRRTATLAEQRMTDGTLPESLVAQAQQLAQEQAEVVELTLKLVKKLAPPTEPATTPLQPQEEDFLKRLDDALQPGGTKE